MKGTITRDASGREVVTGDYAIAESYGKWCGKYTAKGRSFDGSEVRYHRVSCNCWNCRYCGPRKKAVYQNSIRDAAERHRLSRFLTLTLDPKKLGGDATYSVRHLRESFNKFRTYLRRKFGEAIKYIAVVEFQENGFAHLHLLVDRYIEQRWIKSAWQALGGGEHVHITYRDTPKIAGYMAKYLAKGLLSNCPKKARRVTCSRGIKLIKNLKKQHRWTLIRESITWVFGKRAAVARDVEVDVNNRLKCFVVPTGFAKKLQYESPGYGGWAAMF